jgi:hypothetical protein
MMSVDDRNTKATAAKREPVPANKTPEAAPKTEAGKTEAGKTEAGKTEAGKTEAGKTEAAKAEAAKPDSAPTKQGMGEGQKPVSQAYKDNWNAIFAKKKKR